MTQSTSSAHDEDPGSQNIVPLGQHDLGAGDTERRLFRVAEQDPRVTEEAKPNTAETNIETGNVRLRWLMPFALARLGRPYCVWDPQSRTMVEHNAVLPLRPVVQQLADLLKCGTDFIFQLVHRLETYPGGPQNATATDMLKKEQGGGKGTGRLEQKDEEALQDAVWEVCVERNMPIGRRKTNDAIVAELVASGVFTNRSLPSKGTILARCRTRDIETAQNDAYERDHLNRVIRETGEVQGGSSVMLIDCSVMQNEFDEVRVVDDLGNDLGFANTIWGINAAHRGVHTVLGFPGAQNGFLVAQALRLAFIDKEPLLKQFGFVGAMWPFHGLIGELRHDHGSEFVNQQVEAALKERDVALACIDRSPPHTPHVRGKSERFHRTAQVLFHDFLNSDTAAKYRRTVVGRPDAIGITMRDLNRALVEWVVLEYHSRPHSGLGGDSPVARWEKMVLGKSGRPLSGLQPPLEDSAKLKWAFLWREQRVINHVGIQFENRTYRSPILNQLLATNSRSSGRKCEFRFNPYKMGSVYVAIPDSRAKEEIYEIPWVKETDKYFASRDKEAAAQDPTLWEWRQLYKDFRNGNTGKPTCGLVEELHAQKEAAAAASKEANSGRNRQSIAARIKQEMRGHGADAVPKAKVASANAGIPDDTADKEYNAPKAPDRSAHRPTSSYLPSDGGSNDY